MYKVSIHSLDEKPGKIKSGMAYDGLHPSLTYYALLALLVKFFALKGLNILTPRKSGCLRGVIDSVLALHGVRRAEPAQTMPIDEICSV